MLILNFVHCEITECDSDNKQSLILSYLSHIIFRSVVEIVKSSQVAFYYHQCDKDEWGSQKSVPKKIAFTQ